HVSVAHRPLRRMRSQRFSWRSPPTLKMARCGTRYVTHAISSDTQLVERRWGFGLSSAGTATRQPGSLRYEPICAAWSGQIQRLHNYNGLVDRKAMARRNWQRHELLLALNLYCKLPFGQYHGRNPEIMR